MIDIILCCYMQEQYIGKALSSILEQEANDRCHLIVADDGSTDKTMSVIREMLCAASDIDVEILPNDRNLGMARNYQRAFARCKGDYVLILEGDDWWCSTKHIHSLVCYLEEHPEASMCANAIMQYNQQSCSYFANSWSGGPRSCDIHKQVVNNCLGNLSACCFRVEHIKTIPQEAFDMEIADYFLGIYMATFGEIALLPEPTSVWRTGVGQWSSNSAKSNREKLMKVIDRYDAFFSYKYSDDFQLAKVRFSSHIKFTWHDFVPNAAIRICKYLMGKL